MNTSTFRPSGFSPTQEQLRIQLSRHSRVIVEANAGAAKTTTLALCLAQALTDGIPPHQLLALTYTEAAVDALRGALKRMGVPLAQRDRLKVLTFEAFCAGRLQLIEGPAVPRLETPEELRPFVLRAIAAAWDNPHERYREELVFEGNGEAMVEGLLKKFTVLKGTMCTVIDTAGRSLTPELADELGHDYASLRVFACHENLRRRGDDVGRPKYRMPSDATFDAACLLLSADAPFLGMRHPFELGLKLVVVDEMHDTNRAMFTVLKELLLQNPDARFVGVGDVNQVIHSVAGADAGFMREIFEQEIGRPEKLTLTPSFRFSQEIADPAGRIGGKAYASMSARSSQVHLVHGDDVACDRHVVDSIFERQGVPTGAPLSAYAILLRQPHQSVGLENLLLRRGLSYRTRGFDSYLLRPEILLVRGLHAFANGCFEDIENVRTREAVVRALRMFIGGLPPTEVDPAQLAAYPSRFSDVVANHLFKHALPANRQRFEAAAAVLSQPDIGTMQRDLLRALAPSELARRVLVRREDVEQVEANVRGLMQAAAAYGAHDDVNSYFRAMNAQEHVFRSMREGDCLLVASIEAVKGLEFEHVFMPRLNRAEFATGDDTTDNRNLFYVGITRAKGCLTLLFDAARPSGYLRDAGWV